MPIINSEYCIIHGYLCSLNTKRGQISYHLDKGIKKIGVWAFLDKPKVSKDYLRPELGSCIRLTGRTYLKKNIVNR